MEVSVIFIIVFLIGFIMSIVGVYSMGYKSGRKDMLGELIDKKIISTDIYVQLLRQIESLTNTKK